MMSVRRYVLFSHLINHSRSRSCRPPKSEGKPVPNVMFKTRANDKWKDVITDEIFKAKPSSCFAARGVYARARALTSPVTTSSRRCRANGVDDIVWISVNAVRLDHGSAPGSGEHHCDPRGNGEFTEGMGMLVDKSNLASAKRSWRFPCSSRMASSEKCSSSPRRRRSVRVSDADTMLKHNPAAVVPACGVFAKPGCPLRARQSLLEKTATL